MLMGYLRFRVSIDGIIGLRDGTGKVFFWGDVLSFWDCVQKFYAFA